VEHRDLLGECEKLGILSGLCTKDSVAALNQRYAFCNQNDISPENCTLANLTEIDEKRKQLEECISLDLPNASLEYGCDKAGIVNMRQECSDLGMSLDPTATGDRQCNASNLLMARGSVTGAESRRLFLLALTILGVYLFATRTKMGKQISKALR